MQSLKWQQQHSSSSLSPETNTYFINAHSPLQRIFQVLNILQTPFQNVILFYTSFTKMSPIFSFHFCFPQKLMNENSLPCTEVEFVCCCCQMKAMETDRHNSYIKKKVDMPMFAICLFPLSILIEKYQFLNILTRYLVDMEWTLYFEIRSKTMFPTSCYSSCLYNLLCL